MIVADLSADELRRRMRGMGLGIRTGPVAARVRSGLTEVIDGVAMHYAQHPVVSDDDFADFHVSVDRPHGWRRWYKPQVVFSFDGQEPFTPLPGDQGFPLLEWGLNWCVYSRCNQYLNFHSAVLERGGRALLMPAHSGSGKSTLCAALAFRGWRLMSDELALVDPRRVEVMALPRPISLKNASIEVIRRFAPGAAFGPVVHDTQKGSVCHVRPTPDAVSEAGRPAPPAWVVFPKYRPGAPAELQPVSRAEGFMRLLEQAFNYSDHGAEGFATLAAVIDRVACYEFGYGDLDEAVAVFDRLAREPAAILR